MRGRMGKKRAKMEASPGSSGFESQLYLLFKLLS